MKFQRSNAQIIIPNGLPEVDAIRRTTHLAVAAHPDDIEIMAFHGILTCFQRTDRWFTGVVMTDGVSSPRGGPYKNFTDVQMRDIRIEEQKKAAAIGEYAAVVMLDYPSSAVKNPANHVPVEDLIVILEEAKPEVVYTHNLADKHPTHVAVSLRLIQAIRSLPETGRPKILYGCEVWRDLDWLVDQDKVLFDCSERQDLQASLLKVFESQSRDGLRLDLATMDRRRANAAFYSSHGMHRMSAVVTGMDMTSLINDPEISVHGYLQQFIDHFSQDVHEIISSLETD